MRDILMRRSVIIAKTGVLSSNVADVSNKIVGERRGEKKLRYVKVTNAIAHVVQRTTGL